MFMYNNCGVVMGGVGDVFNPLIFFFVSPRLCGMVMGDLVGVECGFLVCNVV